MPSTTRGSITATWLPDKPADVIASCQNTIFSAGDLRDRIEVGFNNPCVIPGTVLLFDFTDESTTLYDKSGFQRNGIGTSIDDVLYKETSFGTGYNFPGAADYFSVAEFPRINEDVLLGITIEVILKLNTVSGTMSVIDKSTSGNQAYQLFLQNSRFYFRMNGILPNVVTRIVEVGKYYHIACTYDHINGKKIYLNGMLEQEQSEIGTITSSSGYDIKIGSLAGASQFFNGTMVAIRVCNRSLDPSEFMHHYYLRTLIDGNFGGSSVLFNEDISTFPKRKAVVITANWKKDTNQEWGNIYIQTRKGSFGEIRIPDVELKDLYNGGLPEVDKYTTGYWIFNGITASKDGSSGLVKDWSGNKHHATLVGLGSEDLVKTKFDRYYDLNGSSDYYTVAHHDQLNPEMQNFTIEMMVRNDYWNNVINQDYFRKYHADSEFFIQYRKSNNTLRIQIDDGSPTGLVYAVGSTISNRIDRNGWYQIAASVNRLTNIMTLILDGVILDEKDISNVTGSIGNANVLNLGRGYSGANYVDGPIAYIRYSIGIARNLDEIKLNAMNFNSRANGIVQDLLVE